MAAAMVVLADLVNESIELDRVPVHHQLRLSRRVGKVHEDTIIPLQRRSASGPWNGEEVARVVNPQAYILLRDELGNNKSRPSLSAEGAMALKNLGFESVELFSSAAAQIPVRGGSAMLGSVHHARVLAWEGKAGRIEMGLLRVFAGEISQMWPNPKSDLLSEPLPEWSMSRRSAELSTDKAIVAGLARQIGWVAPGDELVIDVEEFGQTKDKLGAFLGEIPETRWVVSGIPMTRLLLVRPLYLAAEDLGDDLDPLVKEAITKGLPISARKLLSAPGTRIVRRTILGAERNLPASLPTSYSPIAEASRKL